ncbi:MAG: NADH-quinone oxidoreductase subunit N [Gemmatimonadaceae bacterium]
MQYDLSIPAQLTGALVPDLVLMVGAFALLLWAAFGPETAAHQRRIGVASIALAAITLAGVIWYLFRQDHATDGPIAVDNFRWMVDVVILIGTIGALALSIEDNERQSILFPESHVLLLLASSGMMLLAGARDLMMIFLGIEVMSIAVYALAGMNRRSARSAEGALKYFLLGAFSTAFLLYGIALVYGATGSVRLAEIGARIASMGLATSPLLLLGIALMLVGFAFKVSSVPFHMWAPDVYDGAPTPITAYMAATVKAAAFAALFRVWLEAFPGAWTQWRPAVAFLAVVTMVFGNAIGLAQRNVKRLLAYSSIGHAGYLLVAVAAGTPQGASALVFYLLAYTLATFGAFGVIAALTPPGEGTITTNELSGLWTVRPGLAVAMSVFMLALLGFPVFGGAGFLAKWFLVKAALQAPQPQVVLTVVLVLSSVLAAGYYLYVVMVMFMRPRPDGAVAPARGGVLTRSVVYVTAVALVLLGIFPNRIIRYANVGRPTQGPPAVAIQGPPPPVAAPGVVE